jgi:hypothetical protein
MLRLSVIKPLGRSTGSTGPRPVGWRLAWAKIRQEPPNVIGVWPVSYLRRVGAPSALQHLGDRRDHDDPTTPDEESEENQGIPDPTREVVGVAVSRSIVLPPYEPVQELAGDQPGKDQYRPRNEDPVPA